ncbi:MAG: glutamine--tRNA ligase/YqeY domain fusion protein [Clostridia bacterium]|nr:glutamine--tRNA ligase/YqeY domain fusion protein [Clostridia bacterium]
MENIKTENNNFISNFITEDVVANPGMQVHTRFPPEPNGYLHIGHCKAMAIDFGMARRFGGICNLRMDDTNPAKEDTEYVDAIKEDIHWLGFDWEDRFFYGSDYFEQDYEYAVELIKKGLAYVCALSPEEMRDPKYCGDLKNPAVSPYRDRPIEESLDLFERMKNGEFPEGAYTLRAKIDLASGNFWLRDPAIYRIRFVEHHRQGNKWCIYPLYDFAHPIQDALEGVTHSLCDINYEIHRPLYNWVIENTSVPKPYPGFPRQIEFARMNLTYTVLSKRFLRSLVEDGVVDGWDDPRMPTLCGLRRRGYTGSSILRFVEEAGVAKSENLIDIRQLEACIRDELNETALRRVAIQKPIKVVITNYPEDKEEVFQLPNHPQKTEMGTRDMVFSRELYIDSSDFEEVPPPKFFRLKPEGEVRLMGAYIIKCEEVIKDEAGNIAEIRCTADIETGNGNPVDGRKVKGTIHWLSAKNAVPTTLRLYSQLTTLENPSELPEGMTYTDFLNPESLEIVEGAIVEKSLADVPSGEKFQFVRDGYYVKDSKYENTFNRVVGLKDSFPKK